jgi:DNA-binding transcriptional MocR family regulator
VAVHYQPQGRTSAAIATSVETAIRDRLLTPGAGLPPVRSLADDLGVSPGTVATAYRLLRDRGLVETAGRNGTRVRPRPPVAPRLARMPAAAGLVDLSLGEPDPELLPDPGPALRRIAAAAGPIGYATSPLPDLLAAARERLAPVPTSHLTVTGGALDGIDRVLTAHLKAGDKVAVEDPGWANLLDLVAAHGLHPVPILVDDDGPTTEGLTTALRRGAGAVVITSRAQNPTGATLTARRVKELRGALSAYPRVLVVEDDHAAELADGPLHAIAGATPTWAFLRSASKPYGPDLRLAILAGDETTVARVEGRMRLGAGWVSTILQRLVLEMWSDRATSARVDQARQEYARRRTGLIDALRDRGVHALGRSGVNVWVPVPDETVAVTRVRDAGLAVAPGSLYRIAAPPAVRVSIGPLRPPMVEPLADALADVLAGRLRVRPST